MSETATLESIWRRLDGLQNNVSGVNRRMITLESTLSDRMAALETRLAGLEECADQLSDRISALETSVNSLILLIERISGARLPTDNQGCRVKAAGIRGELQAQLASVECPAHGATNFPREAVSWP